MSSEDLTLFDGRLASGDADYQPRRWVTVSNEMIMARLDWNIMMHRILMVLISQIDSKSDERFRTQRVAVRRIRDLAQVTQKSIHEEAAEAASKLVRQPIEFWSPDKKDYEGYPIFSMCKYRSREGMIEARFNEDARPYLLQLREHFTQYRLRQAIPLSTPYAIRTYEISKMIERPGEVRSRKISLDRFRSMFRLEAKYERHCDMRRRVVKPSIDEVNEKTDVNVTCEDVREGQTPVALKWTVRSERSSLERADEEQPARIPKTESQEKRDHEKWFESLPDNQREEVLSEARKRARNNGYSEERPRSFAGGVQTMILQIYKESAVEDNSNGTGDDT